MPVTENPSLQNRFKYLPVSIRLGTVGGVATPVALRGTPLPCTRSDKYSTAADDQSAISIMLWLGESPLTRNNIALGTFELHGLPNAKAGVPSIQLELSVDQSCKVVARASMEGSDLRAEASFAPPTEFSQEFVDKLLANAAKTHPDDEVTLRQIEAVSRANTLIKRAEERLAKGPNKDLNSAVAALGLALASDDADTIREKGDALERLMSPSSELYADMFASYFSTPTPAQNRSKPAYSRRRGSTVSKQDVTVSTSTHPLGQIFGGGSYTLDSQLCFVLMPFTNELQPLYDDHVKPIVQKAGLRCERADDIRGTSLITHDIWEYINRARFLVAELTHRNPNVFYELGLAHALSKEVILLTQSMDSVPFDLKALRCVCYDFTPRGVEKLERALAATIDVLVKVG